MCALKASLLSLIVAVGKLTFHFVIDLLSSIMTPFHTGKVHLEADYPVLISPFLT